MYKKVIVSILLIACALTLTLACSQARPRFPRDEAIKRARESARQSAPEVGILEARIDSVAAEFVTLEEADRRMDLERGPAGYRPGQDKGTPVWWVQVRGYFRFEGMATPEGKPPTYEAGERDFIYDARTGKEMGSRIPGTRRVGAGRGDEPSGNTLASVGIRYGAIPDTFEPGISREKAVEIAKDRVGPRLLEQSIDGKVKAGLVLFTDEHGCYVEDERGEKKRCLHVPAWVVTFSDVKFAMSGGGRGGSGTPVYNTEVNVAIDAMTGNALEVYSYR